ncbi:MAG: hypothetical protein AAGJ95_17660 [Cyanobacteria bacterium J06554_11]
MKDEELKALVASNAQAIERNVQAIERNAQAIERNVQAIERNAQAIDRLGEKLDRTADLVDATREEIELIAVQVRSLSDTEALQNDRLMKLERKMLGVYDILRTNAREQADRSRLIDQQIQALIDERRQS